MFWGAPDSSFRAFSLHPLQKSKKQKIKNGPLRSDFHDVAQLRCKSQKWEVKNSFFEGHEVIWISVTRQLPGQITQKFRSRNFEFPKLSMTALFWWAKGRRPLGMFLTVPVSGSGYWPILLIGVTCLKKSLLTSCHMGPHWLAPQVIFDSEPPIWRRQQAWARGHPDVFRLATVVR